MQLTAEQKDSFCEKIKMIFTSLRATSDVMMELHAAAREFSEAVEEGFLCSSFSLLELTTFAKKTLLLHASILCYEGCDNARVKHIQSIRDPLILDIDNLYNVYNEMGEDLERQRQHSLMQQTDATNNLLLTKLQEIEKKQDMILNLLSKQNSNDHASGHKRSKQTAKPGIFN